MSEENKKVKRDRWWWIYMILGSISTLLLIVWVLLTLSGVIPFHWISEGILFVIIVALAIMIWAANQQIPSEDDLRKPEKLF